MRKVIEKKKSPRGRIFALVAGENVYEVWVLCENYSRAAKGGIAKTWRYVQKNMDEQTARTLFNRRVA